MEDTIWLWFWRAKVARYDWGEGVGGEEGLEEVGYWTTETNK